MNIVFFNYGKGQESYIDYFLQSINRYMPNANIIQITDDGFYNEMPITKLKKLLPSLILNELKELDIDEIVFVDADMIFTDSIEHILEGDYDVAICKRPIELKGMAPYNVGLMISKNKQFWVEVYNEYLRIKPEERKFFSGQDAICRVIDSSKFKVRFLDSDIYNRSPKFKGEITDNTKVWHLKGMRKGWIPYYFNLLGKEQNEHIREN